jgi:hypothetical protein
VREPSVNDETLLGWMKEGKSNKWMAGQAGVSTSAISHRTKRLKSQMNKELIEYNQAELAKSSKNAKEIMLNSISVMRVKQDELNNLSLADAKKLGLTGKQLLEEQRNFSAELRKNWKTLSDMNIDWSDQEYKRDKAEWKELITYLFTEVLDKIELGSQKNAVQYKMNELMQKEAIFSA